MGDRSETALGLGGAAERKRFLTALRAVRSRIGPVRFRPFAIIAILSLALLAVTVVAWVRSYYVPPDRWSFPVKDGRRLVSSKDGTVAVLDLPTYPAAAKVYGPSVDGFTNDLIYFHPHFDRNGRPSGGELGLGYWRWTDDFRRGVSPEIERQLLDALSDPERFAMAHVALALGDQGEPLTPIVVDPDKLGPGERAVEVRGLRLVFRPSARGGDQVVVDPVQLPKIRDNWHERLGVPVATIRYWQVAAMAAVVPIAFGVSRGVRVVTRRKRWLAGLCPACGYDLRHSPRRCPECGWDLVRTEPRRGECVIS